MEKSSTVVQTTGAKKSNESRIDFSRSSSSQDPPDLRHKGKQGVDDLHEDDQAEERRRQERR